MSGSVAGRIAVITDSTAYLPRDLAEQYDIRIAALQVTIGERSGDEGTEITHEDVRSALVERGASVVTSRALPERFAQLYADAHAASATGVVAVTMSAALSGTFASAESACEGAPCEV